MSLSMINYIQGISQTNIILTHTIINNNIIKNLLINIKTNPIQIAEQKFTKQFLNFNIEKHEFVVKGAGRLHATKFVTYF